MASPLKTGKQSVKLGPNGARVSRIRRDPPPVAKKETATFDREERDRRAVAIGILSFAFAIVAAILWGLPSSRPNEQSAAADTGGPGESAPPPALDWRRIRLPVSGLILLNAVGGFVFGGMSMLTVVIAGPALVSISVASKAMRMRSATTMASDSDVSGIAKQNSSPPIRNSMSDGLTLLSATSANCLSIRSPASWP